MPPQQEPWRLAGTRKCINTGGRGRNRLFPLSETLAIDLTETRWLRDPPYKDHLSLIFHKPWDIRQIKTLEISQHPLGRHLSCNTHKIVRSRSTSHECLDRILSPCSGWCILDLPFHRIYTPAVYPFTYNAYAQVY